MTTVENALQNARIEVVEETTEGQTPTDPSYQVLTDFATEISVEPGGSNESIEVVGNGDIQDHFRGPEEPSLTVSYYKQQAFVDGSGNDNYPAAVPLTHDYTTEYPSYTFQYRRDVQSGGNDGAGFREYIIVEGAKPTELSAPGDPSSGEPIVEELTFEPERARAYVIHQPSSSTTLDVENKGSNSVDVTIEDEGASTTETVTVAGSTTVTTTSSFTDIDVIHAEGEHDGNILVTDGNGTTILDQPLAGSDTTNVDSERGIPPLGSGSHGSAIGTDPGKYLFLGVDTPTWQGSNLSD